MRIAVVSTFYPNSAEPVRAIFVRNLAVALETHAEVTVVSPVPYAPPLIQLQRWSALRAVPYRRRDGGRDVFHPRFVAVPKLSAANGLTYCGAVLRVLRQLANAKGIDVVHAHCGYPDSVGVALASSFLAVPFVVTVHGSDINVYAEKELIRPQLKWALRRARAVVAVSRAIQDKICELAPDIRDRVFHIPCAGVNRNVFAMGDRTAARQSVGLEHTAHAVVFVGRLVPIKAVDVLLSAWAMLLRRKRVGSSDRLVIIGDGPSRRGLERLASGPDFQSTVRFIGEVSQEEVAGWLRAATVFCLPSRNEGTPNVIVEALASGSPVVASAVGGIPDLVSEGRNGFLVGAAQPHSLAEALEKALHRTWDPAQIVASTADYDWDTLAKRNLAVLESARARRETCQPWVR
jgi:teichuronic acid biosynthesis glycosyltransferase TuaC